MIHAIYRLIGIARIVVNTINDMGRNHIVFYSFAAFRCLYRSA
jgi:hypothetical protein